MINLPNYIIVLLFILVPFHTLLTVYHTHTHTNWVNQMLMSHSNTTATKKKYSAGQLACVCVPDTLPNDGSHGLQYSNTKLYVFFAIDWPDIASMPNEKSPP